MDVFRTPSSPSTSDILPTYTLQETSAALTVDQPEGGERVPSSSSSAPPSSSNPWAREKGGRRDLSEYRNSVVLVDEQSGEVIGVLGTEGEVVLDEESEKKLEGRSSPSATSPPQESEGPCSALSSQAVVGTCPPVGAVDGSRITSNSYVEENDFFVDTNNTPTPSSLSPSLQRGLDLLDRKTGPIEPYQPAPTSTPASPSILLTPSPSLPSGLPPPPPPTPTFPSSQRPSSQFQDLRSSPSDISLRTLLSPGGPSHLGGLPDGGLGPSGTTIRRVHSRRMRSGTVTSVGGSSFYTAREANGGTWRGSVVGTVRGGILGVGEAEAATVGRKGTVRGEGEVLLRFFEERESVFVASQPPTSSPLANANTTTSPSLDSSSPGSSTSSSPSTDNELLTPTNDSSSFWSYFSLPSQPLAGASLMWDASKEFFGGMWGMIDFSSASDDASEQPEHRTGHGRYRSSFYYHLPTSPIDPDSLASTVRPVAVSKRGRIPTDYEAEEGIRRGRADVWHVDEMGVGRRAWINPGGIEGAGIGSGMDGVGFC